jgi:hypothetical protein
MRLNAEGGLAEQLRNSEHIEREPMKARVYRLSWLPGQNGGGLA